MLPILEDGWTDGLIEGGKGGIIEGDIRESECSDGFMDVSGRRERDVATLYVLQTGFSNVHIQILFTNKKVFTGHFNK